MKKKRGLLLYLCTFCLFFLCIWGTAISQEPYTLDQCVSIALKENPLILSAYKQHLASLARVNQAKAMPQPSLNFDSDLQPKLFNFKDSGESYFGMSQSIEFPGKRYIRGKIASHESEEILQEIELLKLDITFQVKQAFHSLFLAQEKLIYAQQNLKLAKDFHEKAKIKHETGDAAKVEVLRAHVEASKASNEIRKQSNEVQLAKAYLNFLLARKKSAPIEIKGAFQISPISLSLEQLRQKAWSCRPEVKRISFAMEKEALKKKQAYMEYLPDFDLGVSKHRLEGESSSWDVTLSFSIPLFFWQPKRGEVAEAQANFESLQRELDHLKNLIGLEVEEAFMNAVTAKNQIELFKEEILAEAEEVYSMMLFSYQEGEIGGIELIEARRTLIEARKSYADALFNYTVSLAALEKSVGQNLKQGEK